MDDVKVGSCIYISGDLHRIICVTLENVYTIRLNIDKIDLFVLGRESFDSISWIKPLFEEKSPHPFIDMKDLSEEKRTQFTIALSIVREVEKNFGPTYIELLSKKKTGYFVALSIKYGVSVKTIWKYIRKYLQSGFDMNSLIDGRLFKHQTSGNEYINKPGRKRLDGKTSKVIFNDSVKENADKIIKMFKSKREMTIKRAYQIFVDTYYSEYDSELDRMVWLPAENRPTLRQFEYYLRQKMSQKDLDEKRSSKIEVLNNKRILLGSSRTESLRPGWVVECDAVEVDLSLVSEKDPEQTVGRPIMYIMIDVLTSCILAVSASYENNSIIGLTNLFLNLFEDKVKLCQKHGISIKQDDWPSNVIPREIRCDHGSDFMSSKFQENCRLMKINLNYETPGVGSKKGIVEQSFHQFHASMRPNLEGYGLITKRHDSKHHEHAMLTMAAFKKMVLHYVIYHNSHMLETYNLGKEMLEEVDFSAAPNSLWKHYAARKGTTFQINDTNRINYIYNLLFPDNAKLSRVGVEYKGLFYINQDENLLKKMYIAGAKKVQFQIKYDPRTTSKLYYQDGSRIMELKLNEGILNNEDFKDMTWKEYAEYEKQRKEFRRKAKEYNIEHSAHLSNIYDGIIETSMTSTLPSKRNLSKNRKLEKYQHNKSNSIDLFGTNELDTKKPSCEEVECVNVKEEKPIEETVNEYQTENADFDELIDYFINY